jgi:FkbM family methyltransferase
MYMQRDDHVGHSIYPDSPHSSVTTIESTTLEEFLRARGVDRVDFLKLDCEGAEFDILLNAADAFLAKVAKVSMEVHPGESRDPTALRTFLEEKGFRVATANQQMYARR